MAVEIVAEYAAPGRGPSGLAWDGRHLWHSDHREGLIYQLDHRAEVIRTLWCPGTLSGLTWDGQHLWQAVLDEGVVRSIDPASTDFDQTIGLHSHGLLSGVAWDGLNLRVVAQQSGDILTIERETSAVIGRLPGPVAIGDIDYANGSLWLSTATPMSHSAEAGFSWLSRARDYALVQLDGSDGRELARHHMARLYTGLTWGAESDLWLASAEGKLYRATLSTG